MFVDLVPTLLALPLSLHSKTFNMDQDMKLVAFAKETKTVINKPDILRKDTDTLREEETTFVKEMEELLKKTNTRLKEKLFRETERIYKEANRMFKEREAILVAQVHLAKSSEEDARTVLAEKDQLVQDLQRHSEHLDNLVRAQLHNFAALEETTKRKLQRLQHQSAEKDCQLKQIKIENQNLRMERDDDAEELQKIEAALEQAKEGERQKATDIEDLRNQLERQGVAQVSEGHDELFTLIFVLGCAAAFWTFLKVSFSLVQWFFHLFR